MAMNERIKELLQQAGMESPDFPYDEFGIPTEQEKFAELIIKECCTIVNARTQTNNPNDCLTVLDIKEHFGVE